MVILRLDLPLQVLHILLRVYAIEHAHGLERGGKHLLYVLLVSFLQLLSFLFDLPPYLDFEMLLELLLILFKSSLVHHSLSLLHIDDPVPLERLVTVLAVVNLILGRAIVTTNSASIEAS